MKLTVRTLDSQNHSFDLDNENITVKEFKEHIASTVNIPVEKQRIIFQGKVLNDDKKLNEYNVDGCVVHLVQRAPPPSAGGGSRGATGNSGRDTLADAQPPLSGATPSQPTPNIYIGAISTANDDLNGVAQNLVESLISQFGAGNVSASHTGNSLNVNINVQAPSQQESSEVQRRLGTARRFISHAEHLLQHIIQPESTDEAEGDAGTPPTTTGTGTAATASSCPHHTTTAEANESAQDSTESSTPDEEMSTDQSTDQDQNSNTPQALGMVYSQFLHFYQHLLPILQRYEYLLNHPDDTNYRTTNDLPLPDQMAEIFHDLSHAFHALSDISFNFLSPIPQTLMCYPQMSPVRFPPPPIPRVHMSSSTSTSQASSTSTSTSHSVPRMSMNAGTQRTPVAVAAISTVVHIPAGTFSNLVRNNANRGTATVPSSATSSPSLSASPSTTTSSTPTSSAPTPESIFQSLYNDGSFGPNMQGLSFSSSNGPFQSAEINVGGGQNTFQMSIGQQTVSVGGGPNEGANGSDQMNLGLQNIMQNLMQNMPVVLSQAQSTRSHSQSSSSTTSTTSTAATISSTGNRTADSTSTTSSSSTSSFSESAGPSHDHHHHHHHHFNAHNAAHQAAQAAADYPPGSASSGATNQRTYRPHTHHHHHHQDGSVIHPDSLLPCGSFHFGPTFHQAGQRTGNRPHPHVVEVSGIMIPEELSGGTTSTSSFSSSSSSSTSTSTVATDVNNISNILSGIFGSLGGMPGNPVTQGSAANTSNTDNNMDIDSDTPPSNQNIMQNVGQLFQSFLSMGGSGSSPTLREFIQQNVGLSESGEDSFLTDFLDMMADNMTMNDLMGLIFQSSTTPLSSIHEPLRKLIEKYYNDNRRMEERDIPDISSKIADSLNELTRSIETNITVRSDVDLNATLRAVDQCHVERLLRLLLAGSSTFGPGLRDWFVQYAAWNFAVLDYAVTGGADRFMAALLESASVLQVFQEVTPPLRQLALQSLSTRLRAAIASHPVSIAEVTSILVRPGAKASSQRENPCKDDNGRAAKRSRKNEKVDVNRLWEEENQEVATDSDTDGESPPSPEDWHSLIPNDWVIIFNRDAERQRKMGPQRPYSDAYISGLPPKRRKIMTPHGPEADHVDVKASLNHAIKQCGVQNSEKESIEKDIDENDLQEMFETTFRHDIRQRLQGEEDYRPHQHPNSEEYFMKGKGK